MCYYVIRPNHCFVVLVCPFHSLINLELRGKSIARMCLGLGCRVLIDLINAGCSS